MRTITIEAPGKNALGYEVMGRLIEEFEAAGGEPVLLTGAGDAFSAGLNLAELLALDVDGMTTFIVRLEKLVETMFTYSGPLGVAVNGHAIAGGCVMTLCGDYRVMTTNDRARMGLNEVALGVRFPPLTLAAVRARLPVQHSHSVLLRGALHRPSEALRLGLVDLLSDDPIAAATKWLQRVEGFGESYSDLKAELRRLDVPSGAWDSFVQKSVPIWTSEEVKSAIKAVLSR